MMRLALKFLLLLLVAHLGANHSSVAADTCIDANLKVNHIQGHIVAAWQGGEEPIPKAEIELKEFRNDEWQTKLKITTDETGFFRIEDIPSGEYQLFVRTNAFRTFATSVRFKESKSNPNKEIIIRLGIGEHDCGSARVQKIKRKQRILLPSTSNNSFNASANKGAFMRETGLIVAAHRAGLIQALDGFRHCDQRIIFEADIVFCPKCGDLMKELDRTFYCERGDMYFSERMAKRLSERYGNNHKRADIELSGFPKRRWVCFECAIAQRPLYVEPNENDRCPQCGSDSIELEHIWYCPGCGVPINRDREDIACSICLKSLREFRYELVEFHPHKNERGEWR